MTMLHSDGLKKRSGTHEHGTDLVKPDEASEDQAAATPANQETSSNVPQDKEDKGTPDRILKTICLFYSALTVGWCTPLLGQTLVHMEYFFDVSTATMSIALTVQALGGLFGAVLCGLVFDQVNHELVFAIGSLFQGLSYIMAPYTGGIMPFIVFVCIQATSIGLVQSGGQSYCVGLWKGHRFRDPILHTWSAVWSLGAMTGPFIAISFLVDLPQQHSASNIDTDAANYSKRDKLTTPSSWNLTNYTANTSSLTLHADVPGLEKVGFAYVTIGLLALITHVLFVIAFLRDCFKDQQVSNGKLLSSQSSKYLINLRLTKSNVDGLATKQSACDSESHSAATPLGEVSKRYDRYLFLIFIAQVFLFYHLYRYGQAIPAMYMTTFAIKYLKFPVQSSSLLMSLYYAFNFIGRVIGIPAAAFIQPKTMLIFNVVSTAISFLLFLAFVNVWPTIIWITATLAGFSMSTTVAAGMLWISDRLTITGRLSALILGAHSSGAIVGPSIVGQLFETTPMWFVYSIAASSVGHVVLLIVFIVYNGRYGNRVSIYAKDGFGSNDDKEGASHIGYKIYSKREERLNLIHNIEANESQNKV